jgi:hypothetical protein
LNADITFTFKKGIEMQNLDEYKAENMGHFCLFEPKILLYGIGNSVVSLHTVLNIRTV